MDHSTMCYGNTILTVITITGPVTVITVHGPQHSVLLTQYYSYNNQDHVTVQLLHGPQDYVLLTQVLQLITHQ